MTPPTDDVVLAVQKAIVAALRGSPAFAAVATVWDAVPQNQPAPYVALQYLTKTPWPVRGMAGRQRGGWEVTANMLVWTGTPGAADALEVVKLVDDVLDEQPLTVTGYKVVRVWNENTDTSQRDADGYSRGVPMRYRAWVQIDG